MSPGFEKLKTALAERLPTGIETAANLQHPHIRS